MRFDPEALRNKQAHLDAVRRVPGLVEAVVARHLGPAARLSPLSRPWEPGGGSTLFRIDGAGAPLLLKVKHRSVWVESGLESEPAFLRVPSLENERDMLRAAGGGCAPRVAFFDEEQGFQFLALEWLEPFEEGWSRRSAGALLAARERVWACARRLFDAGIVHTDLHERNLCFRGDDLVIVDWEEARRLRQQAPFEASLDVVGRNRHGSVGFFPDVAGAIRGLTCLRRLDEVFRGRVRARLPELMARCGYGPGCAWNRDPLQEPEQRIYQSLEIEGIAAEGQRPARDPRMRLLAFLLRRLARTVRPIRHLDVGSNAGAFCLRSARLRQVERAIGVDASADFVELARAQAFLLRIARAEFHRAVCGAEPLAGRFPGVNVVTLFSVYHHIDRAEAFLDDLRTIGPACVIGEFPTQPRFYPARGSLDAEMAHIQERLGFRHRATVALSADYRRPIVVFSHRPLGRLDRLGARLAAADRRVLLRRAWRRLRPAVVAPAARERGAAAPGRG